MQQSPDSKSGSFTPEKESAQRDILEICARMRALLAQAAGERLVTEETAAIYDTFLAVQESGVAQIDPETGIESRPVESAQELGMDYLEQAFAEARQETQRLERMLLGALAKGDLSLDDIKAFVEGRILTGEHVFNNAQVLAKLDQEAKAYMAEGADVRRAYESLLSDPLAQGEFLAVGPGRTIAIEGVHAFAKRPLPEKKKKSHELAKALKEAHAYRSHQEGAYARLLDQALAAGRIGQAAHRRLAAEFGAASCAEREGLIGSLPLLLEKASESSRKAELLRPEDRKPLLALMRKGDLGQLEEAYSLAVAAMEIRLSSALDRYRQEGLIGKCAMRRYQEVFPGAPVKERYRLLDGLEPEMASCRSLWLRLAALNKEGQLSEEGLKAARLRMDQDWGYAELKAYVDSLGSGAKAPDSSDMASDASSELSPALDSEQPRPSLLAKVLRFERRSAAGLQKKALEGRRDFYEKGQERQAA